MIIGEIIATDSVEKTYFQQKFLYDLLSKKNKKFYFINCYNLINKKIFFNNKFCKNKKIIFYNPKSFAELNYFLTKNKIFLINNLSPKLYHLKIHLQLNKKNIFQVSIDNLGILSSYYVDNWENVNLQKKIHYFYIKKFAFFIHRLLILLGFIKTINILYLARRDIFQKYVSSGFRKLPINKRYKNIIPVKPRQISINQEETSEKFISYIDTNIDHEDLKVRATDITTGSKEKFITDLKIYLSNLENFFKKKVILCLHPSSDESEYKKIFKGFKIVKHQTEKYLSKSFLVLFHESSITNLAILMNKKMISIITKNLGKYLYLRTKLFNKNFNFVKHNVDVFHPKLNKSLIIKLNSNVKNYQKSLNKLYFLNKETDSIFNLITDEINLLKNKKINY